jgi:ABC-type uncharacterized transport system auxiliary subunit
MSRHVNRSPTRYLLPLCLLLLGGCSGGLRSSREAEQIYVLRPAATGKTAGAGVEPVPGILRVVRPEVQPGLDTSLITIVRASNELDHLAASRWGASLPKVLTAFAVESLSRSGDFQLAVGTEPGSVQGDFELLLTVRHFEAVYAAADAAPTAHVMLDCMLTTGAPKRVLGRCDAEAQQVAADNRVGAIVTALELAAQQAIAAVGANAAQLARNDLRK